MNPAVASLARALRDLDLALSWLETGLIHVLFGALVVLGLGMIPVVASGLMAADTALGLAGLMLTWLLMLGAVHAVARSAHPALRLARIPRLAGRTDIMVVVLALFSGPVCLGLVWAGWKLLVLDISLGSSSHAGVPTWPALVALPIGFALMAVRFISQALEAVIAILRKPTGTG